MTQTTDTETTGELGPEFGEFVDRALAGESISDLFGVDDAYYDQVLMTGYRLYKQGNYDKAEVLLRGARTLEPKEWYPHVLLGDIVLRRGNAASALKCFERALECGPPTPAFVEMKIAEAAIRLGDIAKARRKLELLQETSEAKRAQALLQALDGIEERRAAQP